MASVLQAQKANARAQEKRQQKRKAEQMEVDEPEVISPKKTKKNKQRVLLLSSRGITHRMRHFMNDLEALLPHVKKGALLLPRRGLELMSIKSRIQTRLKITAASSSRTRRPEQLQQRVVFRGATT